ncbi:cupin domain-containing protein [Croceicoccus sp. BE223]|uniref:cupin domain-containing protein n=1 Tax=Croceicoccus sp. BE223 TaxID=2817716 RepID=UPI0028606D5E|nr:cupin domain-containing protein [Croceicoccus sp. BE223]MDR7101624.1 putative cupin superfamily protein [Croceicoccus sp. BE223]
MTTETRCLTAFDVGAFARANRGAAMAASDPFGADSLALDVSAGPCEVGTVTFAEGEGEAGETRGDVLVLVLDGTLTLRDGDTSFELDAGQAAGIGRGTDFAWSADEKTLAVFLRYPNETSAKPGIIAIDNDAPLAPSNPPAAEVLLSDVPQCRANNMFVSADTALKCGIWDSTPYQRIAIHCHHTELMHLLAGSVTFVDGEGTSRSYAAGDTVLLERGADATWDSRTDVAKIYATWRTPA